MPAADPRRLSHFYRQNLAGAPLEAVMGAKKQASPVEFGPSPSNPLLVIITRAA